MAAKPETLPKDRKRLTQEQEDEAYSRYVFGGEDLADVARALGVHRLTVRGAWQRGRWEADRVANLAQSVARRKAHGLKMALRRDQIQIGCADLALTRVQAQQKVADHLLAMASGPCPHILSNKESGQGIAAALGAAAPDIEKARLSVDLTTVKTEQSVSPEEINEAIQRGLRAASASIADRPVDDADGEAAPSGSTPGA